MLPLLLSEERFFNVLDREGVAERDWDICEVDRWAAPGVGVGVGVAEVEVLAADAEVAGTADEPSNTTEPR